MQSYNHHVQFVSLIRDSYDLAENKADAVVPRF